MIVVKFCYKGFPQLAKLGYTQSGPIMNGGVMARCDMPLFVIGPYCVYIYSYSILRDCINLLKAATRIPPFTCKVTKV